MYLIPQDKQKISDRYTRSNELISTFKRALDWFGRSLKKFIKPGKVDPTNVQKVTEYQVKELMGRMNLNGQAAFEDIMEDGMSSVGINMIEKRVDPNTVRALYYDSPIWTAYRGMSDDLTDRVNETITEHLTREGGISYTKLVDELRHDAGTAERKARVIARTETNVVRNKGKEIGFHVKDPEGKWRYKWGGPYDRRTSDTCKWIQGKVPGHGLSMDELKRLVHSATRKFHPTLTPRDWTAHPNCRHFPQKVITRR